MKKRFCIIFALFLAIMIGSFKNVLAMDNFELGVSNLNNTAENSAKLGDILSNPEKGWKRYDETANAISYDNWGSMGGGTFYKGNAKYPYTVNTNAKFNFTGSKIRLFCWGYPERGNVSIYIDNIKYIATQNHESAAPLMFFEKKDLSYGEHTVRIVKEEENRYSPTLDAIDIDESGELKPYNEKPVTPASSIALNKTSLSLQVGQTETLLATVLPENATNKKVVWTSSDPTIATVDENGNVTAIKEGQATITAKVENTNLIATCEINVTKTVEVNKNRAILSISLVNGATKEYDVSMQEVDKFINWFEERSNGNGLALYSFSKKISPYKSVREYIIHSKIASFEVREYEVTE